MLLRHVRVDACLDQELGSWAISIRPCGNRSICVCLVSSFPTCRTCGCIERHPLYVRLFSLRLYRPSKSIIAFVSSIYLVYRRARRLRAIAVRRYRSCKTNRHHRHYRL